MQEFLNNLLGPGTEQDRVDGPARQATQAGRIDSFELIPRLHKSLKIPSQQYCSTLFTIEAEGYKVDPDRHLAQIRCTVLKHVMGGFRNNMQDHSWVTEQF